MTEAQGEKPMIKVTHYTDAELVQWALKAFESHGINKHPDMVWHLAKLAERLKTPSPTLDDVAAVKAERDALRDVLTAITNQGARSALPRFTAAEVDAAVWEVLNFAGPVYSKGPTDMFLVVDRLAMKDQIMARLKESRR